MTGRLQRIVLALAPRGLAAAIEKESREWRTECPACGAGISVWEAGGIRYKASGTPRRLMRCGRCGVRGWNKIQRRRAESQQAK